MGKIMPLEQILAKNVASLMEKTAGAETIDALAKRSGVGRGTVGRVKNGEVSTKIETVEKLAAALGVSPVQLLTDHGSAPIATSVDATPNKVATQAQATFAASLDPKAKTADERELLTMYRHANDVELQMFSIAVENVRERIQREDGGEGESSGATVS